ncbi:MAG: hypothetical protein ABFS39_17240 [Pseudomonadota bacterium]
MTNQDKQAILQRLLQLVQQLYTETEGLAESESDLQLWYNRGYANGMIRALREKNQDDQLLDLINADRDDYLTNQEFLPWGKAYRHGFEMGEKETREVL